MKATLCLAALAATLAASPAALAQTAAGDGAVLQGRPEAARESGRDGVRPNRGMKPNAMQRNDPAVNGLSGSTGGAAMGASGSSDRSAGMADIAARRGRGQNDLELSQTTLLNRFSAAGYTTVRDFRKTGDRYTARAQDRDGRWASVELDPRSGTITPR